MLFYIRGKIKISFYLHKKIKNYIHTPILSAIPVVINCIICNCHENDKKLSIFIYKNNLHKCKKYDNIILGEALWGQRVVHTLLSFVQVADEVDAKGATIGCRSFCISDFSVQIYFNLC